MSIQLWTVITVVFLGYLGISIPYLLFPALFLLPEYAIVPETWSVSTRGLLLGITLAAYPFGQFLGSPVLGTLSDDYGRRKILSLSLICAAACSLLCTAAIVWHSIWLLIFGRFAMGLMEGNIAIARALAADMKAVAKAKSFGMINAAASLAYLLGPFAGGFLIDSSFSASTPFLIIGGLFFGLSILSFYALADDTKHPVQQMSLQERIFLPKRLRSLFQNSTLKHLIFTASLFSLATDFFYQFGPIYLTEKWNLSPTSLAWYNGVLCATLVIGNGWLAQACSKKWSRRSAILGAMSVMVVALVGISYTSSNESMFFLFSLTGASIAVTLTNLTILISDAAPEDIQGEALGVQTSLRVLADTAACLLGALLMLVSSVYALLLGAVVTSACIAYYSKGSILMPLQKSEK